VRRLLRWLIAGLLACALAPVGATAATGDPLRSHQWGLDMIHADEAHAVTTGAGAVVAVVDTGIDSAHADLQGRVLPGHDFVTGDATPQDGNGHGTHVSGIIAADAGNGIGVDSVAPGAKILPVRVLDDSGEGSSTNVAAGIDWATANGANVINLSLSGAIPLGGLGGESDIDAAIARALDRGVVVVVAAGNDALPLCENNSVQGRVLCVGAVDKRGNRSFYSSFGQGLGLVAPGGSDLPGTDEDVLSTWNDGQYMELAGTSQAAPHVSGVAALLVSLGVRGQAAVQRILATAADAGPPGPDLQFGAGIVNAAAAVAGLGHGGASAGGGSTRGSVGIRLRRTQRIRSVLRSGIRIACSADGSGRCRAAVKAGRRTIARGSANVALGKPNIVVARLTRAGAREIRRALRTHRGVRATVTVTLPGAKLTRKLRLAP
jgi:subtilisin family serine protease